MKRPSRRSVLLTLLLLVLAIPTVVRATGDHAVAPLIAAAAVVPYAAALLVVLLLLTLVLRRWRLAVLALVLVAVSAYWLAPLWVADPAPPGTRLTAMTANLRLGQADPTAIVRAVRQQHVDVLALQELTPSELTRLRTAGITRLLPYSQLKTGSFASGSGLLSRYPLAALPTWPGPLAMPGATLVVGNHQVVIRLVHPWPTTLDGAQQYARDYATLRREVRALPTDRPTILLGDFNATRDQSGLRQVMGSRFRDAPELAGSGFLRTWTPARQALPAILQLDHVLVDDHFGAGRTEVLDLPGSDHHALVAQLVLRH